MAESIELKTDPSPISFVKERYPQSSEKIKRGYKKERILDKDFKTEPSFEGGADEFNELSASQVLGSGEKRVITKERFINTQFSSSPMKDVGIYFDSESSKMHTESSPTSVDKSEKNFYTPALYTFKGINHYNNVGDNSSGVSDSFGKKMKDSPGKKEFIASPTKKEFSETNWRALAKKQAQMITSYSPMMGMADPSKEESGHSALTAMFEDNMSKVETLKKLDNREAAINLIKEIIHELETYKEKYGELDPDEAKQHTNYKIHAYNRLGLELYEVGDYNEVLMQCKKAIELDACNLQALYKGYQAHLKLGNKDKYTGLLTRIRKLMQTPMILQYNKPFLLDNLSLPNQSSQGNNSQEDLNESRLSQMSFGV